MRLRVGARPLTLRRSTLAPCPPCSSGAYAPSRGQGAGCAFLALRQCACLTRYSASGTLRNGRATDAAPPPSAHTALQVQRSGWSKRRPKAKRTQPLGMEQAQARQSPRADEPRAVTGSVLCKMHCCILLVAKCIIQQLHEFVNPFCKFFS